MEKELCYVTNYSPIMEKETNRDINFLCKDNKLHIRLKRFGDKQEIISGFENKLTFFITYLINEYCKDNGILDKELIKKSNDKKYFKTIINTCLKSFILNDNNLKEINRYFNDYFKENYNIEYKGIAILPMYLKESMNNALDYLGNCDNLNIPSDTLIDVEDNIVKFLLHFKLYTIGLDFLFDDGIYFSVCQKQKINYDKFINKYKNKDKTKKINLW